MSKTNGISLAKRISTGVAGLDGLLEGGFLSGRSYLVTGDAGTGKTTACMQFLMAGLKQGERSVYVTVDERPAEILQAAGSLDWDLQTHVQEKTLVILDASPYFSGRAGAIGGKEIDLTKFVTDLAGYANKLEATRLAIDPITPLILSAAEAFHVQENARALIHLLQTNLTTTNLLTSHLPARGIHDSTQGIEEFLAAGVIVLSVSQANERLVRSLGIKKMRGTAVDPCELLFNIAKGKGMVLLSSEKRPIVVEDVGSHGLEFFELPKD
jgi:KaiC/GvpD/RAD55 family RecA-like ATPase